jgi:hypothetical protein
VNEAQLHAAILAVLPTGLPGKGHMTISRAIAARLEPGQKLPTHQELRSAIGTLERRKVVHSMQRPGENGEPSYRVFWRDASYVPPLDVKVSS